MTVQPFRASVGLRRISASTLQSQAVFTQAVREQIQGVVSEFNSFVQHLDESSAEILLEALQPTFELSQYYCPVKTGDMLESGYLEVSAFRGHTTVEIGYGKGGEPPYTVFVHENPDAKHEAPTRYKWLQQALEEDIDNVEDRIKAGYKVAAGV